MRRRTLACCSMGLCAAMLVATSISQAEEEAEPRVTGSGGRFLHYSSRQSTLDLTPAQQAALLAARDAHFANVSLDRVQEAVAGVLREQGYSQVEVDPQFHLVEAEHYQVLVSKARQTLRGLLKSKAPMPARADHQTTFATVLLMPLEGRQGVAVRCRFKDTVWDSNGDAQTQLNSDPQFYQAFYRAVAQRLGR